MILRLSGLLLCVLLLSCSGDDTGPASGTLDIQLTSPNSDDGAVLLTIAGGPVESVEPLVGGAYTAKVDDNTMRVVVTGNLTSTTIARLHINDMNQVARYSAAITQVAVRSTYATREPAGYSILLIPSSR
jgi:hypothetical protein